MSDYYEYGPQIELKRATVITGYLSDFTRSATYRVSAMLGLPYYDIERLVEHESGMAIAQLLVDYGEARYREIESRALARSLEQKPTGLVALGDGGLLKASNLALVQEDARLIVLDFDLGNLFWRIQLLAQQPERGPWHPQYRETPGVLADIRPFYQERRGGFDQADHRIFANSLSPAGACQAIMEHLGGASSGGEP